MARKKRTDIPKQEPTHLPPIATHLPSDDAELFAHCSASWTAMTADARFATPSPTAAEVDQGLKDLNTATQAAKNGGPTEKATLKKVAREVRLMWGQLAKYVHSVLRTGPVADAGPVLTALLMSESKVGKRRPKDALEASDGPTSGTVQLVALAILGALTYEWEWSSDQVNWSTARTGQAHITLSGLTPGKTYSFRFRVFLRDNTMTDYILTIPYMVK